MATTLALISIVGQSIKLQDDDRDRANATAALLAIANLYGATPDILSAIVASDQAIQALIFAEMANAVAPVTQLKPTPVDATTFGIVVPSPPVQLNAPPEPAPQPMPA